MKRLKPLVCLTLTSLACATASTLCAAQTVYRCGNSYGSEPCANGVIVQADDARSEAQRAAAQAALDEDKKLADALETTRKKDEALARKNAQAERAAQVRIAAAKTRAELNTSRQAKRHTKPANARTARVQEDGVFTATAGKAQARKTKSKTAAP